MGKVTLMLELVLRSILPPFYSFARIEAICIKRLRRKPDDKYTLWVLSNLYIHHKQYREARPYLDTLYRMRKDTKSVRILLSRVYYHLGEYEKVVEILERGKILSPAEPEVFYLGDSLIELKEFRAATDNLSRYVNYHHTEYVAFVRLGYAYYMQGLFDLAIGAYTRAEALDPRNREIKTSIELCAAEIRKSRRTNDRGCGDWEPT